MVVLGWSDRSNSCDYLPGYSQRTQGNISNYCMPKGQLLW